jgi:hypothetical protein
MKKTELLVKATVRGDIDVRELLEAKIAERNERNIRARERRACKFIAGGFRLNF